MVRRGDAMTDLAACGTKGDGPRQGGGSWLRVCARRPSQTFGTGSRHPWFAARSGSIVVGSMTHWPRRQWGSYSIARTTQDGAIQIGICSEEREGTYASEEKPRRNGLAGRKPKRSNFNKYGTRSYLVIPARRGPYHDGSVPFSRSSRPPRLASLCMPTCQLPWFDRLWNQL